MFLKSPPELVLASTSRYRCELLNRLGIDFTTVAPGVQEQQNAGESARALAIRLAREKAAAVALQHTAAWVVGSDQVALLQHPERGEQALGKPGTVEACRQQLQDCSGRSVEFLTAVAVVRHCESALYEFVDVTRVTYRNLDATTIDRYIEREQPLDCAGGFKSEALGISLCDSIDSCDPTALIGLPLIRLSKILRRAGYLAP